MAVAAGEMVSLWASTEPMLGVPATFLEGSDPLLTWLEVDYGVAIDGSFSTNYTAHGDLVRLGRLLEPLPASASFSDAAIEAARGVGIELVSFVVALYDCAYQAPAGDWQSPHLRFVGAFPYERDA